MITSRNDALPAFGPDVGGSFTVTVTLAVPSVKPFNAASFFAAAVTPAVFARIFSSAPA